MKDVVFCTALVLVLFIAGYGITDSMFWIIAIPFAVIWSIGTRLTTGEALKIVNSKGDVDMKAVDKLNAAFTGMKDVLKKNMVTQTLLSAAVTFLLVVFLLGGANILHANLPQKVTCAPDAEAGWFGKLVHRMDMKITRWTVRDYYIIKVAEDNDGRKLMAVPFREDWFTVKDPVS